MRTGGSSFGSPPAGRDPVLTTIHAAMLGGTLIFFVVGMLLVSRRPTPEGPQPGIVLRWAWFALAALAVFGAGVVRGRLGRGLDDARLRTGGIVIWALAEGVALLGIVSTIVSGDYAPAFGATLVGVYLMIHHRPSQLR